jgi:hypothetical protein
MLKSLALGGTVFLVRAGIGLTGSADWQDTAAAKRWVKAGRAFDRTHTALTKIQLPEPTKQGV